MTSAHTIELVRDFRAALPAWAARALHHPSKRVNHLVTVAVDVHGWTPEQLAADSTRSRDHLLNPGGAITHRLGQLAAGPPPQAVQETRKVHHGCCDNGLIYDETTDPPTVTKCPGDTR